MSAEQSSAPPANDTILDRASAATPATNGAEPVIDLRPQNPRQLAHASVEALVGDIVHVFRSVRPGRDWPEVATAVLEHHEPPIDQADLDPWYVDVQDRSRFLLRAVEGGNVEAIRRAIDYFREIPNIDRLLAEKDSSKPAPTDAKLILP